MIQLSQAACDPIIPMLIMSARSLEEKLLLPRDEYEVFFGREPESVDAHDLAIEDFDE